MRPGWSLRLLPLAALASLAVPAAALCPQGCRCDDTNLEADCTDANLDSFPITLNPRLKRLVLVGNAIHRIDRSMVSSYVNLEFLDLSLNGLMSVQAGSFERQSRLVELQLAHNQLTELEPGVFRGLRRLRALDLSYNQLHELPERVLNPLQTLTELNLASNRLPGLAVEALAGAVSLRRLNLANNLLRAVPVAALATVSELDSLDLAGNSITRLERGELARAAPRLADLSLAGNQLSVLPGGTFSGLDALRRLNIADVGLAAAEADTLAGLSGLEELELSGNPLSRLGAAALGPLHRLRVLSVRACPGLNTVEPDTFRHTAALETVKIEENPSLTALPDELFLRLPLLRRLSLRANALTSLSGATADWQRITADLSANPWRCDCALRWLLELPDAAAVSGVLCAAPESLRGRPARRLSADELSCDAGDAGSQAIIIGCSVGAALLVVLLAVAACYRFRSRLQKALKALSWRDRVGLKRKEQYHRGKTYYCHDMYDPIHPRESKPIPVTEL